jgi:DNA-directed RNA polymerase subunit alpha
VEISLNLKQLGLNIFTDEPVKLELKAKGEKKVTAKDIKTTSDVEVINSDLVIATLTSKTAELNMEILVTKGRGYVPSESREKEDLEVGMIVIDSIFTPIKNVGFQIENVRVGKMTNYENLIITIETDGTITPKEALNQSVKILLDHFNQIAVETKDGAKPKKVKKENTKKTEEEPEEKTEAKEKEVKKAKKADKALEEDKEDTEETKEEKPKKA